ncbi:MAG TPA: 4-hydroxy-tetrahydrodipicolinate reductase [Cytophagaceae bacterium]|jgi:4-hydroxy-tetrahydrodipicolinate reductase|nr:4-hydroxy-tetrahydrodipicolinate reductase [Cytophagaceae bacterium]
MRIMLIGYGKMGKIIEQIALKRGHTVPVKINSKNGDELKNITAKDIDAVIEFTQPEIAFGNIKQCIENGIPVVSGTTGWLDRKPEIEALCKTKAGAFFYASNFSVGVNLFFHFNKYLAKIMNTHPEYSVSTEEIHHTAKKDAPSGTGITIAEGILENIHSKKRWVNKETTNVEELSIISKRIDPYPGEHSVIYSSPIDNIEIKHTAHTREGFATGALMAAEFIATRKGIFGMEDMLKF